MKSKATVIFILGMSGAGKDTLTAGLTIPRIPSVTTRPPRPTDDPRTMFFLKDSELDKYEFAEQASFAGAIYGTLASSLLNLEGVYYKLITPQGLAQIKDSMPELNYKVIYIDTELEVCKSRVLARDTVINESRFGNSIVQEFNAIKDIADLVVPGTEEGREILSAYILELMKETVHGR